MQKEIVNKTMDRDDLFSPSGRMYVEKIHSIIEGFQRAKTSISGWHGTLTDLPANPEKDSRNCEAPGGYEPLPNSPDDPHFPWFLYWEIYWALRHTPLEERTFILDAGGSCSLFWAFANMLEKYFVYSCEILEHLVKQANDISKSWLWDSEAVVDDVTKLSTFNDGSMDAVFSICVMEHLTVNQRRRSIQQIHRVLKPGGTLTITFDYKNPRPAIFAPDPKDPFDWKDQLLSTPEDLRNCFMLDEGLWEILYNKEFYDNQAVYLGHPKYNYAPYTFGALFLRRR